MDGQTGFCIVLTVRNQDGGNPWATVEDITFRKCVTRDTISVIQVLGVDDTHPSGTMKRVSFDHCRFEYREGQRRAARARRRRAVVHALQFLATEQRQVAGVQRPGQADQRPGRSADTDANEGMYGIHGDDTASGQPTLDVYAPDAVFTNVTLWRGPSGTTYPYPAGIQVV